jgi:hypothetical protein
MRAHLSRSLIAVSFVLALGCAKKTPPPAAAEPQPEAVVPAAAQGDCTAHGQCMECITGGCSWDATNNRCAVSCTEDVECQAVEADVQGDELAAAARTACKAM